MKLHEALSYIREQMLDPLVLGSLQIQQYESGDVHLYQPNPYDLTRSSSVCIPAEHLKAVADYLLKANMFEVKL